MKEEFQGFIFDVDGTLTSTNELIFASFNHVAQKYLNKIYTQEELIALFGPPEDAIIRDLTGEMFEEARKDYFEFYYNNHNSLADLYPGMLDILKAVKKSGKPVGVFTGKGREAATITLKILEVFDYFDLIVTGDDVKEHKPAPEGIHMFLEKFSLPEDKVLLIGDAPADIIAARAAGIKIASVVWDSYAKEKVLAAGSDYIFHTVEELKTFIEEHA